MLALLFHHTTGFRFSLLLLFLRHATRVGRTAAVYAMPFMLYY